jgi:hypothetical protein
VGVAAGARNEERAPPPRAQEAGAAVGAPKEALPVASSAAAEALQPAGVAAPAAARGAEEAAGKPIRSPLQARRRLPYRCRSIASGRVRHRHPRAQPVPEPVKQPQVRRHLAWAASQPEHRESPRAPVRTCPARKHGMLAPRSWRLPPRAAATRLRLCARPAPTRPLQWTAPTRRLRRHWGVVEEARPDGPPWKKPLPQHTRTRCANCTLTR